MSTKKLKKTYIFIILLILLLFSIIFTLTCAIVSSQQNKTTTLQVVIHDEPFKLQDKNVEALNIKVVKIDIIRSSDKQIITLMEEPKEMDILKIEANNPVVLSTVSVEPGQYEQLRLILSNDNTIVVDGETFPIIIPSGEQTGVKIDGLFEIPAGKFFKLTLDFVAKESVIYNQGQGYKLKPVIELSGSADIIGIFRGNLASGFTNGKSEMVIELYNNNSFRAIISDYSRYKIKGKYYYNSFTKILKLDRYSLSGPGIDWYTWPIIKRKLPSSVELYVKQWSLNEVIVIDQFEAETSLFKVDSFSFSGAVTFTNLQLTIQYPDSSKNGKTVAAVINFIDSDAPPISIISTFANNKSIENIEIPDYYFPTTETKYNVVAYILEDKFSYVPGVYGGNIVFQLSDAYFSETTDNPWQTNTIFTLVKGANNICSISFPTQLNIQMEHNNFSTNNPIIKWIAYPGANNGYFVVVLTKDKIKENDIKYDSDGNNTWDIVFSMKTNDIQTQVFSSKLMFVPVYPTGVSTQQLLVESGELIRIEVYVLDSSGFLDTGEKTGAIFMDSLNIIR